MLRDNVMGFYEQPVDITCICLLSTSHYGWTATVCFVVNDNDNQELQLLCIIIAIINRKGRL